MSEPIVSLDEVRNAILTLHNERPHLVVVFTTGGAAGLQNLLWQVEGLSRTLLHCGLPYKEFFLGKVLGSGVGQACNADMALRMAAAAYLEGLEYVQRSALQQPVIGLGVTCALATDRVRRGSDRIHIAVKTADAYNIQSLTLRRGALGRIEQGFVADIESLNLLLEAAGVPGVRMNLGDGVYESVDECSSPLDLMPHSAFCSVENEEQCERSRLEYPVAFNERGTLIENRRITPATHVLYPGSFAPLTYGHAAIARTVRKVTGLEPVFTISRVHPTKGEVPRDDLFARLRAFFGIGHSLVLPAHSLYIEKARLFPGMGMVIGVDALEQLQDPRFYRGSIEHMAAAIDEFAALGTTFHVVGRKVDGVLRTLREMPLTPGLRKLCKDIHGDGDSWDISSTMVRSGQKTL